MPHVSTEDISLEFTKNQIETIGEFMDSERYRFEFDDYDPQRLFVQDHDEQNGYPLLGAAVNQDNLNLRHLEVPAQYKRSGLGKFAMAFYYYLLKRGQYPRYKIRIGGGTNTKEFLEHLGFNTQHIHTDTRLGDQTVLVGKYKEKPRHNFEFNALPINTYPTHFFNISH